MTYHSDFDNTILCLFLKLKTESLEMVNHL